MNDENKKEKVKDMVKAYQEGFPIFVTFFNLNDKALKAKLKCILGTDESLTKFYSSNTTVRRIIDNEKPSEIILIIWNHSITISPFGIMYHSANVQPEKLKTFNKNFNF